MHAGVRPRPAAPRPFGCAAGGCRRQRRCSPPAAPCRPPASVASPALAASRACPPFLPVAQPAAPRCGGAGQRQQRRQGLAPCSGSAGIPEVAPPNQRSQQAATAARTVPPCTAHLTASAELARVRSRCGGGRRSGRAATAATRARRKAPLLSMPLLLCVVCRWACGMQCITLLRLGAPAASGGTLGDHREGLGSADSDDRRSWVASIMLHAHGRAPLERDGHASRRTVPSCMGRLHGSRGL